MALQKFKELYGEFDLPHHGWSSICTQGVPRMMLNFTRYLLTEENDVRDDFIQNVMSTDTYKEYHYFPTLIEIRRGIAIEKYEKIPCPSKIYGKCFCDNPDHTVKKWIDPYGITPEEGIEMLDNMIKLGADPKQFKFRKIGVDSVDKSKYDQYARPLFK